MHTAESTKPRENYFIVIRDKFVFAFLFVSFYFEELIKYSSLPTELVYQKIIQRSVKNSTVIFNNFL